MKIRRYTEESPRDDGDHAGISPPAYDYAQRAAVGRRRSAYIKLTCRHYTTWDDDLLWSALRPLGPVQSWCDKCAEWIPHLQKQKPAELPEEPLF